MSIYVNLTTEQKYLFYKNEYVWIYIMNITRKIVAWPELLISPANLIPVNLSLLQEMNVRIE